MDSVVAGFLAAEALSPRELANKIKRQAGPAGDRLDLARTAEFVTVVRAKAELNRVAAVTDANVARFVLLGIIMFFIGLVTLSDVACRNRIGRTIAQAEREGIDWEANA